MAVDDHADPERRCEQECRPGDGRGEWLVPRAPHDPDGLAREGQCEEAEDAHDDRVSKWGVGLPAQGVDGRDHCGEGYEAEGPVVASPDTGVDAVDEERAAVEGELGHGPAKEVEIAPAPEREGGERQPGQECRGEHAGRRQPAGATCGCSERRDDGSPDLRRRGHSSIHQQVGVAVARHGFGRQPAGGRASDPASVSRGPGGSSRNVRDEISAISAKDRHP